MPAKKKTDEPELDEGPAEETPADQPVETAEVDASGPRPWRVETFEIAGEGWGWRLCDATGDVVQESGASFEDRDAALADADDNDLTEGARFLDRETTRRW